MPFSLQTLPVDMIYGILDHLDVYDILISCRNICQRLNAITDSYRRYQVILIGFIILTLRQRILTVLKYLKAKEYEENLIFKSA